MSLSWFYSNDSILQQEMKYSAFSGFKKTQQNKHKNTPNPQNLKLLYPTGRSWNIQHPSICGEIRKKYF